MATLGRARQGNARRGRSRQSRLGAACRVKARHGVVRLAGAALLGVARHGQAWHGRQVWASPGSARHGSARRGMAVKAWQATQGLARLGAAWPGAAWQGRQGTSGLGPAALGWARHGMAGGARPGGPRRGWAWFGVARQAGLIRHDREGEAMSLRDQLQNIYDQHGQLTPALVVDIARDDQHPLHDRFEWNDAVAGEAWRRQQAHELIRSVRVVYREANDSSPEKSVRAFHAVRRETGHVYEPVNKVVADDFTRRLVLNDMEREWKQLHRRYQDFEEFAAMVRRDLDSSTPAA